MQAGNVKSHLPASKDDRVAILAYSLNSAVTGREEKDLKKNSLGILRLRIEMDKNYNSVIIYMILGRTKRTVWRRVRVPISFCLNQFHHVIQAMFDWTDTDRHEFYVNYQSYLVPELIVENGLGTRPGNEVETSLASIMDQGFERFSYSYWCNFMWECHCWFEERLTTNDPKDAFRFLEGERATPPEDAPRILEYEQLIEILRDPEALSKLQAEREDINVVPFVAEEKTAQMDALRQANPEWFT